MEKRDICKSFFVSKSEAEKLHKNADRCGMTEGEYVRYLINGIKPKVTLPKDFHSDMEVPGCESLVKDIDVSGLLEEFK